jgi:triacylglycerol esterase/lipase EstA (alpha/beta hydrolase family)
LHLYHSLSTIYDSQNIILGYSMGGLVARYGLAQMVRNGQNTQTRLLLTLDSPHHGANFPLGLQHLALAAASVRLPWFGGTAGDMNVQL